MSQGNQITLPRPSLGGVSPDDADARSLATFFTSFREQSQILSDELDSFFQDFESFLSNPLNQLAAWLEANRAKIASFEATPGKQQRQ